MNEVTKIEEQADDAMVSALDPMISLIERVVMNPDLPMERVSAMFDLQERQMGKAAEQEFNRAFSRAMAQMPAAKKSGLNKHTQQKYSTLSDLVEASRPALSANGLALNWVTHCHDDVMEVTAIIRHESGHKETNTNRAPIKSGRGQGASMNDMQAQGSTETYLKRYTGFALLGLSSDDFDDDGNGSGKPVEQPKSGNARWVDTILSELPTGASDRDKAVEITRAICAQFKRMKTERQTGLEWDRRAETIEAIEKRHPDLHETIVDAYENHVNGFKEAK